MADRNLHKAWLGFVRKMMAVPEGYDRDELAAFRSIARREMPSAAPIISAYLNLALRSELRPRSQRGSGGLKSGHLHLFDLLREERFFPQNLDLARFAARVLPQLRAYRFDKMSRTDIAGRIIDHIEQTDPTTRTRLEESMREALEAMKSRPSRTKPTQKERESFLSRWERIIKGVDL